MSDGKPFENLAQCPLPLTRHSKVQLAHGSGGRMMNELIRKLFLEVFNDPTLSKMEDCATLEIEGKRLTFSTDSYVVDPIFFPGGNIGELAVNGTVNDVSMAGARPLCLSVGFILEEGFPMQELHTIVNSMQGAARHAGVAIVTGDTKEVNKGKVDKIFINTSGVGVIDHNFVISPERIETGDCILLSGTIGDHGIAVLSKREGLSFESPI
jgi:hydrogenase expression/formation protein HypE